jgi:hypothetical protein
LGSSSPEMERREEDQAAPVDPFEYKHYADHVYMFNLKYILVIF